jgi:hypothetical protein
LPAEEIATRFAAFTVAGRAEGREKLMKILKKVEKALQ